MILAIIIAVAKTTALLAVLPLNALFTIILCRYYADFLRKKNQFAKWKLLNLIFIFITLIIWYPLTSYLFEYGTLALMFTICGVMQREQPGNLHTVIAFALATIIFIFIQYISFGFSVAQFILMAVGTLITTHLLSGLKMKQVESLERFTIFTKAGLFLARNSLYFYFLHIIIFAVLSRIVFSERYTSFKWFF